VYRYLRLRHNNKSQCQLSELQFYGVIVNDIQVTNLNAQSVNIVFTDGFNNQTLSNVLTYSSAKTPQVLTVSPSTGSVFGGEILTLSGSNLNFDVPSVVIDGIECVVNTAQSSPTQIVCTTGARLTLPE
jgi:hypothetical protein